MILSISITYLIFLFYFFKTSNIYANDQVCDFNFDVKKLSDIYEKYEGKKIEVDNSNNCDNLESLNSVKAFWMLKLKALCTEKTSILDKHVLNNICSQKYDIPHIRINGLTIGKDVVNLEFVCAHFLYSNNKEIIKCIKSNSLKNYLDSFHIAFDLSISQELLKQSDNVDLVLNLNDLNRLNLVKQIIDDSLCRIHSSVHTIMSKNDFDILKVLVGLCTKLGFHNHFILTDNIHPLFNPLYSKVPHSLNALNFNLENTTLYYANYEYFLYNIKLTDAEYTLNSYMSPSVLTINQNNSFVTWVGLKKDNNVYNKKFDELYELLGRIKYIERIIYCYSKYTSRYYESSINYFLKYLPEDKRDIMQNNGNIFIYLIKMLCNNIPSIHQCVYKIISLNGIYDIYFKNFMINFIYYNASCIFNCNSVDLGKLFNDDHLWDLFIKYFSHSYLVKYKKKNTNTTGLSNEYSELAKLYYTNYDYDYIHSGKWRKEINLDNEDEILRPSDEAIEYEFYNYTYQSIDLSSYSFFILKSKMYEDNICKIASFIEANGKKYVHTNNYINNFFNKNNKRVLSHDDGTNETNKNVNEQNKNNNNEHNSSSDNDSFQEDEEEHSDHMDSFNLFDGFLNDYEDGNGFLDILKNNNLFGKNKLFEHIYGGSEDGEEDYLHSYTGKFDIENHKINTKIGDIYPLKRVYDYKELQEIYEIHPNFSDSDEELRNQFFKNELFEQNIFFTVRDVQTRIKDFYKYYYEIKKKLNSFNELDDTHYNMLLSNSQNDPNIFSKINVDFACTKSGTWPVRKVSGRWISEVLCEAYLVPQLIYNYPYAESKKKENNKKDNIDEVDTEMYLLKEKTRLIGIEFEEQEPHRCAISYLGDESKKSFLPISASLLIKIAIGFCVLHGFKTIWIADSAFDIHTNIYLRYTSILEKGLTYYEQSKFELYGQTRLVPKLDYITSGMNIKNNIITSGVYKNMYSMISFPGIDLKFQLLMSKKVKNTIYNLKFDCHSWAYEGCSEYYPLMKKNKKNVSNNYDTIILNGRYTDKEKEEMYQCPFMHDKNFIELNKMFPKECTFGSRIGDCHEKVRKSIPCYDEQSCKYQIYIYEEFLKPRNHLNLLYEHFIKVSENLTKLARPYYLQSILSLEHDIQIKKSNEENSEYDEILLFILKNSVYYVSWVTSSEFWKRAIHVQDSDYLSNKENEQSNKEFFCPLAYAHEYIRHILVQYMKFPNI
ncbi:rhoptry protein 2, putative [Plasmodium gallinaceum]|uniref:Rhoptry protein 2, putative n=1 Tax=Plasmodium gallinaceum TaxID=5849 RepID=A0A1J1H2L9_PLAGA|nr:rhoptry protein 2, putative [Plasmodium gallinaceum]CRG97590.1 rhoptry protein 2, putative [Plasmodium gallinaceum]